MGFGIKKEAGSNTTPSDIVNFDKLTPTTVGVVFTPNTPATLDTLYVSSVDASTWIWNGTAYITYSPPAVATTEWYLLGTTIDAGSNKTAPISRNNSIYTQGYDSYFNGVRVGLGLGNIATNTSVGNNAGASNTTGDANSFFGYQSGYSNTTGRANLAIGYKPFFLNTTGNYNVAIGTNTLYYNTIGNYNTAIGISAGLTNTTGNYNVFLGLNSGYNNTTGSFNTFTGSNAGYFNTADYNTFNGVSSGRLNTTGTANTFIGALTGNVNTTGSEHTFVGFQSGLDNTTGTASTFIGSNAGSNNTTGSANTFISSNSGLNNTTGSNNTFIGTNSGAYLSDGTTPMTIAINSTFLGTNTKSFANNQTNEIAIGFSTIGKGSNTVNIGNTSITNTYLNGAVTFNNAFTFPTTDGTANQVLKTNGSGTVTWGTAGSSSGIWGIANSSGVYTYYATWALAVAAATSGQVIELFADITETTSTYILKSGVNIQGNGHTITFNNSLIGFYDNDVACTVVFSNINLIKTQNLAVPVIQCFNDSSNIGGYNTIINVANASGSGFYGSGTVWGFTFIGQSNYIITRFYRVLIINNCSFNGTGNLSLNDITTLNNCYMKSTGTVDSGNIYNSIIISTSNIAYQSSVFSTKIVNSTLISMTSYVIQAGGGGGAGFIDNCYIYSAGARPISTSAATQYHNSYIESATSYINQYGNNCGSFYNCTLKVKLQPLFNLGEPKLYNCNLINEWNNVAGRVTEECTNVVMTNNYISLASSSAFVNYATTAKNIYMYGNAIKGTSNINSVVITNLQTNTADAQGNVILN